MYVMLWIIIEMKGGVTDDDAILDFSPRNQYKRFLKCKNKAAVFFCLI